jgi:hypothetical protein
MSGTLDPSPPFTWHRKTFTSTIFGIPLTNQSHLEAKMAAE